MLFAWEQRTLPGNRKTPAWGFGFAIPLEESVIVNSRNVKLTYIRLAETDTGKNFGCANNLSLKSMMDDYDILVEQ